MSWFSQCLEVSLVQRTTEIRYRHTFSRFTVVLTLLLMGWGAFVTSIDAGLAVPDWPTSFRSWDPLNPFPSWWKLTPILAEHGHRLIGAIVGACTLILAFWTAKTEKRSWLRKLVWMALGLVIFQGLLGGLRVVFRSLDLAVVHACTAQVFLALLVIITLFTSESWMSNRYLNRQTGSADHLKRLTALTSGALFGQIILGALLRHPGTGINFWYAGFHITGAIICTVLIFYTVREIRHDYRANQRLYDTGRYLGFILTAQIILGLVAYFVLLDESGLTIPTNLQVVVNTAHLVLGALLWSTAVLASVWARRSAAPEAQHLGTTGLS